MQAEAAQKTGESDNTFSELLRCRIDADAYPEGYEDVPRRLPDIAKIKALTGWRPRRPLPLTAAEMADAPAR